MPKQKGYLQAIGCQSNLCDKEENSSLVGKQQGPHPSPNLSPNRTTRNKPQSSTVMYFAGSSCPAREKEHMYWGHTVCSGNSSSSPKANESLALTWVILSTILKSHLRELQTCCKAHLQLPLSLSRLVRRDCQHKSLEREEQNRGGFRWKEMGEGRSAGRTGFSNLGLIQTSILSPAGLIQAAQICVNDFAGTDLNSPIGVTAMWHTVTGNKFPYSELGGSYLLSLTGYSVGLLASLLQGRIGLGQLFAFPPLNCDIFCLESAYSEPVYWKNWQPRLRYQSHFK